MAKKPSTAKKKAAKARKAGAKKVATKAKKAVTKKVVSKVAAKKVTKKAAKKTVKKAVKKAIKKTAKKVVKKTAKKAKVVRKVTKPKLPKCPLTKKQLREFREMLLAKRRTLLGDMTGMEAEALRGNTSMGEHSSMPVHMADIGTDNYEQEFTLGLLESERQLLREIDEALERMAIGTYGVCMGTGAEISKARLRAKPWAKYAIAYVRKIEQGLVRVPAIDYGMGNDEDADFL